MTRDQPKPLSPGEMKVLRACATGVTDKVIARDFGVSSQTVRNQLSMIYRKLGVSNRVEAFIAMGWLKP